MQHPQIAQRVFHTPLLAARSKAASFVLGLGPRILDGASVNVSGIDQIVEAPPSKKPFASLLDNRLGEEIRSGKRDAFRMVDGVAVIPITGVLIHRGAWIGSFSGETSYEGIGAQIEAAADEPFVRGIALEIDSHGGEVAGCFDLADRIRQAREKKPVHAFVADHAYSAAYALASQADRVIVPRAGGVGSIGVICMHADYSRQLDDVGVPVTIISAGEHKGDGNPYEPLPESVRSELEAEMEALRRIFADTVAEGRGDRLTAEGALSTEAACLQAQNAVEAGLADEVSNPREAFERFTAQFTGRQGSSFFATDERKTQMGTKIKPEPDAEVPETTEAVQDTPEPEATNPVSEPKSETAGDAPQANAAQQERDRIAAIQNLPEAAGREDLARSLSFDPAMTVDQAKKHLAASPKAGPKSTLSDVMGTAENDTDLDIPGPSAAEVNPVRAAHKQRFAN